MSLGRSATKEESKLLVLSTKAQTCVLRLFLDEETNLNDLEKGKFCA